jgi:signal transduction histidine kinase
MGRTFYDADGRPIRFDGVTLDITDRRRSEDALRDAKNQAEQASRAKDEFLAQLSHELRTPLTPVLMTATELSEDDKLPFDVREQLKMISRNVELEARLIDDLLDLTRIARGKLALRLGTCDLHSLLRLTVEIVDEETREKRIELTLDLDAARSHLTGDPARLQQVFWNLLRNAVKFTPDGGHVRIHSRDYGEPGVDGSGGLRIEVGDDGIGFDPAVAESLFLPFERGSAAQAHRYPGLGLGLAIARAIVDLHGGRIFAASAGPGRGATFTVELPGARPIPDSVVQPMDPLGAARGNRPTLRLLVVEDHESTRDVLTRLLQRAGHQVTTASNVAEALAAAENKKFDLVISDLGLPDGTGLELMEQLRARHGLRGIALSGYGMDEDRRRTSAAGFIAHLIKPVQIKELRGVLDQFETLAK